MLEGKKVDIQTNEGFEALPADKYTVQIVDVNLKTQLKFQSTEEEEVLEYQFQVLDDNPIPSEQEGEQATTRGRYLWKKYRLSLNSRSHLGKLAAAVEGRPLTKVESADFDPESLVGKQLDVMVEQNPSKKDPDIVFNNIISHSKVVKQLEALPIEERNTETVQKTTSAAVPATAPDAEAQSFVEELEAEGSQKADSSGPEGLDDSDEEDPEVLELQLKLAKAKAAKAKK